MALEKDVNLAVKTVAGISQQKVSQFAQSAGRPSPNTRNGSRGRLDGQKCIL